MEREKRIYRVTLIGSLANVLLVAIKLLAGLLCNSAAMLADAVHSLSDFITDILVIVFVRISAQPCDDTHDYGHGKYETIASFIIGLGLLGVSAWITGTGVHTFIRWYRGEQLVSPGIWALWTALLSIVIKEVLYRYTIREGRRLQSEVLEVNAWHHRSDALSSIAAALGIGGAILAGDKWSVLDPLASAVVGILLVKIAFDLLRKSINDLSECSLPLQTEQEINNIILAVPGVCDPHNLRTRRIGNRFAIEVHVRMDGKMSLEDAHQRASLIEKQLRDRFGPHTHVMVHTEPIRNNIK